MLFLKNINYWSFFKKLGETRLVYLVQNGDPAGNRTRDSTLRGLRLSRLTTGPRMGLYHRLLIGARIDNEKLSFH